MTNTTDLPPYKPAWRERQPVERAYVRKRVYKQCREGGMSVRMARIEAAKVADYMLPDETAQPLAMAIWLEKNREFWDCKDK